MNNALCARFTSTCTWLQALARIHALGVLHGDVREENILLDMKDSKDAQKQCQVTGWRTYVCVCHCFVGALAAQCQ